MDCSIWLVKAGNILFNTVDVISGADTAACTIWLLLHALPWQRIVKGLPSVIDYISPNEFLRFRVCGARTWLLSAEQSLGLRVSSIFRLAPDGVTSINKNDDSATVQEEQQTVQGAQSKFAI